MKNSQTPKKLLKIYDNYKDDPAIKFKTHFREALKEINVYTPPSIDDWRDKL